ncbi:MAG: LPXTG cell wall anchor domain-containing protein [Leucobacter sp.]
MTKRRPVALGAAVTIGFGSLFFASPALAEESNTDAEQQAELAASLTADEAPVEVYDALAEVGIEVAAVGVDANGAPVLVETEASAQNSTAAAEETRAEFETVLTISEALEAYAATDVAGGAGYLADFSGFCSIGFAAWSPSGDPVLLSAGHCTGDGTLSEVELVLPSVQPAVTGYAPGTGGELNGTGLLGTFGFSQFGGPGNSVGLIDSEGNPVDADDATDIAVIENIGDSFELLPAVTDWTTALDDDLAASTTPIKTATLADPVLGSTIEKSGRTTGHTTGEVQGIVDGWAAIEDRWVRGFQSNVLAAPGDSGGAVFQGTNALGVISGGSPADEENEQFTWTSSLKHALTHIPGYEIALDIDAPVIQSPSDGAVVAPGTTISGSAPSNATAVSSSTGFGGGEIVLTDGNWSMTAPTEPGDYTYSFTARNGKSSSESVSLSFTVEAEAPLVDAPTINDVSSTENDIEITGTGIVGAAVTLSGDVTGTATVDADGNWSIPATLEIGKYDVSATQTVEDVTSPAATGSVTISPVAPAITSIVPGTVFPLAEAPSAISGIGHDGATVVLDVSGDDTPYTATVVDGAWTVELPAPLAAGSYVVTASQNFNGVGSATNSLQFSVETAPVPPTPTPEPTPEDPTPGSPTDPTDPSAPGAGEGGLANTGDSTWMLMTGLAGSFVLIAGGAVLYLARRRQAVEL